MGPRGLRVRQLGAICVGVAILVAAVAVLPGHSKAASPSEAVLEFVTPAFPVHFTAEGGEVTAALTGFNTVVHCAGSSGEGEITGPRTALSNYVFTGCETRTGTEGGRPCQSEGADTEEIRSGEIEAELVFISQLTHSVGMLLAPDGGVYLSFECGGEPVVAIGPFLSPVGPINTASTSFTADLHRAGATQTPDQYEGANGEPLPAIPTGERNHQPPVSTGVELGFTIHTGAPLEVKAVTATEIEDKRRTEQALAEAEAKRRQDEAARAAAEKQHQEEESVINAAAQKRLAEEAAAKNRARHLTKALKQCRKIKPRPQRTRCESRAKKKFGSRRIARASQRA
jgi:hypothetical protein